MDNQQVTATELAWLAGIVDGEGSISVRKNGKNAWSTTVSITNTNSLLLEKCRDILERLGVAYGMYEKPNTEPHKQCWVITCQSFSNNLKLLTPLVPYLTAKRFQADRMVEFIVRRAGLTKLKYHARYTEQDYQDLLAIVEANGDRHGTSETIRRALKRAKIESGSSTKV